MEINILLVVAITVLSITIIGILSYLIFTTRNLKDRVELLAMEMIDFHSDVDHQQVDNAKSYRDYIKEMDTRFDRINRKMEGNYNNILKHDVPKVAEKAAEKHIKIGMARFINSRANNTHLEKP
jgi:hypothetical protein